MNNCDVQTIDRAALARLLADAHEVSSRAIGASTLYRLLNNGRETLAIALADGHVLLMAAPAVAKRQRRRKDA